MRNRLLRDAIGAMLLAIAPGSAGMAASGGYELPLVRVATTGGVVLAAERNARTLYVRFGGGALCTGDCALDWPPFLIEPSDFPTDGLVVVHRPDGSRQWSLGHRPLHFFAGDAQRGDANGDGIGHWRALRPAFLGDTPSPGRAAATHRTEAPF